jgi:hypothetical protein
MIIHVIEGQEAPKILEVRHNLNFYIIDRKPGGKKKQDMETE